MPTPRSSEFRCFTLLACVLHAQKHARYDCMSWWFQPYKLHTSCIHTHAHRRCIDEWISSSVHPHGVVLIEACCCWVEGLFVLLLHAWMTDLYSLMLPCCSAFPHHASTTSKNKLLSDPPMLLKLETESATRRSLLQDTQVASGINNLSIACQVGCTWTWSLWVIGRETPAEHFLYYSRSVHEDGGRFPHHNVAHHEY